MKALGLSRFVAVVALAVVAIFAFAGSASAQPGYGDGDGDGDDSSSSSDNDNDSACVSLISSASAGTITAVGDCFNSGESVTGTLFSDAIDLGTKEADGNGVVAFTIVVKDLAPGEHKVVLDGAESGSESAKFTVSSDGDVKVVPASFVTETPAGGSDFALVGGIAALLVAGGAGVALLSSRRSKSRV